ncbi:potassium-transporting ATPase subunit KdpC [Promicromonospora thailandica]|uniref:Potassium-transporting ATPase KdpC subunit n=1 Tax=Promicromonospora thailandica TaxID=765201 RepID=A0A9X2G0M1_9MICO|nr:potassium-transporting ATPase subunit KdpC [Promicromonospora thailandica]MCP2263188.1 K+-transporting ATPase ATPase C chain [Promicromonospora thailandica]BFF18573.1 K(+)-transporting ATPase subunit C [Promicromonospora thailandica]
MASTTVASDLATLTRHTLAGLRMLLVFTLLLGLAYPLAMTAVGQVAFPWQASGSLVRSDGSHTTDRSEAVGSTLVAQAFEGAQYFHPRPSAAGDGYDTLASAASNLGPLNPDLVAAIEERKDAVAELEGVDPADVPADAVTSSGSGLDPQISPEYAAIQVARVARERGLPVADVEAAVEAHTAGRDLGVLGEPRVDVLELNLALDDAH